MTLERIDSKFNVGDIVEFDKNRFGRIEMTRYTKIDGSSCKTMNEGQFDYFVDQYWRDEKNILGKVYFDKRG